MDPMAPENSELALGQWSIYVEFYNIDLSTRELTELMNSTPLPTTIDCNCLNTISNLKIMDQDRKIHDDLDALKWLIIDASHKTTNHQQPSPPRALHFSRNEQPPGAFASVRFTSRATLATPPPPHYLFPWLRAPRECPPLPFPSKLRFSHLRGHV